jgi:dCMP deaminase
MMGFQTKDKAHRPDKHRWYMDIAHVVSERATCVRRKVGCVVVDVFGNIQSTGYNGVPRGVKHCFDVPCPGATESSGQGLDRCQAVHAEVNAIAQCPNIHQTKSIYCTTAPCVSCLKLLINTGATHIYFAESYPQANDAGKLWCRSHEKRQWIHLGE